MLFSFMTASSILSLEPTTQQSKACYEQPKSLDASGNSHEEDTSH